MSIRTAFHHEKISQPTSALQAEHPTNTQAIAAHLLIARWYADRGEHPAAATYTARARRIDHWEDDRQRLLHGWPDGTIAWVRVERSRRPLLRVRRNGHWVRHLDESLALALTDDEIEEVNPV